MLKKEKIPGPLLWRVGASWDQPKYMVIISKYQVERNQDDENILSFWIISKEEPPICPECKKGRLYPRDRKSRSHKLAGGIREWYIIRRLKCEECGRLHNELPDCLVPYKHYDAQLIEDVVDGTVSEEDPETEDYPCENTMKHWKWWLSHNETSINGQIRSSAYRLLDLGIGFLRSKEPLLKELRKKICPGWLSVVTRIIYNSGGRIEPYPED